ncbi:right-handed parallel beta-helix repeat-containing protein [Sporobolomyces salmoneus]|uniref:right-handed parallel beta-helix repeat-containing protein n=1 Tax=Sporobolomyces salmoneus TaxID=183962 RepID=UPI00316B87EB
MKSSLLVAALLPVLAYATSSQSHFSATDCLDSASLLELNTLLRTGGAGTSISLCPFTQIAIDPSGPPLTFTAPRQSIHTAGFPDDHSRATLVIESDLKRGDLTTAIKADCDECRGVRIEALHIDGGREQLGGIEGGDALILVGGNAGEQDVRNVDAFQARGYAIIHADEGAKGTCTGVTITENEFHSAGDAPIDALLTSELRRLRDGPRPSLGQERPGKWTDAVSVACAKSTISENTIRDVSGVGIAIRGAPGSQVHQNTIVARDRDMLVGISLVANPIFVKPGAEIAGVSIRENRVHAASAMIRVGISTGSGSWSTDEQEGEHQIPFGSEIVKNRISSYAGYYGYAMALSDARGIVVEDNAVSASIWGFETTACYSKPAFIAPTPLLRDPRSVIGRIQPQFVDKHFGFALCVGPGSASSSIEVSRHQINDLSAIQARAMAQARSGGGGTAEPQYDDEDDGLRGPPAAREVAYSPPQRRGGNRQQVVHPAKAYKAVKARPPKPPAIPKMEWHPVHPLPGSKEANALKFQEATKSNRGGILSLSQDVMGDHTQAHLGERGSEVPIPSTEKGGNGKKGIEIKRLRGKRKLGSTRSVHHFF